MDKDLFNLLNTKSIIEILDGDKRYEEYSFKNGDTINIGMPYLSGPTLCDISTQFGLSKEYYWDGGLNQSRWQYLSDLIKYCIDNKRMSELLAFLFKKEKFLDSFRGHGPKEIEDAYETFISRIIEQINGELYFCGNELVMHFGKFLIRPIETKVDIESSEIEIIDRDYIKETASKAFKYVEEGEYDIAVTKSRTLLEEVFCYAIEAKNEDPSESGQINVLYKQVKELYSMHADSGMDKRINTLLSGLEKIVSSVSEMRNKASDSHGIGNKRIAIEEHHARLIVNASVTMSDFILSVCLNQLKK